jgi:Flp pilus assembly protein TadG
MRIRGRLPTSTNRLRRGAAAVELAILLTPLTVLLMVAIDFARAYFCTLTLNNCARNGALYASDPVAMTTSKYANVQAATIADGTSLSNPTFTASNVTSATGTDSSGNPYVVVTVAYAFPMATGYLGFQQINISRQVQMRVAPAAPN